MLMFAEVAIGSGSTLSCSRCGGGASATPRGLSDVERDLSAYAADSDGVWFTGIEPFTHPQLPSLVAAAREAGYDRIGLRTDAGALSQGGNAAGVLSAGVRLVEVVLLGSGAATHDAFAGAPGLFAAASAGMHAFSAAAQASGACVALSARIPVCKHSLEDVPATVAAAAAMGAGSVIIDAHHAPSAADAVLRAALDTATLNRMSCCVTGQSGFSAPSDRAPWGVMG